MKCEREAGYLLLFPLVGWERGRVYVRPRFFLEGVKHV